MKVVYDVVRVNAALNPACEDFEEVVATYTLMEDAERKAKELSLKGGYIYHVEEDVEYDSCYGGQYES